MTESEAYQAALERLDALAAKLGVAGEHLWGVMVAQQTAYGWYHLSWSVAFLVLLVAAFWWSRDLGAWVRREDEYAAKLRQSKEPHLYKYDVRNPDAEMARYVYLGTRLVAAIALGSSTIQHVQKGLLRLLNPEFYAIRELRDLL